MRLQVYILLISLLALISCDPQVVEKSELGPAPTPTFEVMAGSTTNEFILKNTTNGAFLTQWDLGSAGKYEGQEITVGIPFKGTYDVSMTTFSRGGHATATGSIEVTTNDPNICSGNFELLTGCGSKTWKLAPEASAMHIGPNLNETWWGNNEADVATRACHFDDEFIFSVDGTFEYDNKGDFWVDVLNNAPTPPDIGLAEGCQDAADWPEKYKAWDSGVHKFSVTTESLTLTGLGAWMGLYKVGTTEEVIVPQTSVTYTILSLTADRMTIYADLGFGIWRFTFVSV